MSNSGNKGQRRGWDKPLIEHPLVMSILGGMVVAGILALIKKFTHLIGHVSYTFILLAVGVIALLGGLPLLIRYRRSMNAWQYTSIVALVLAGSALTGATARGAFPSGSSGPPTPKHAASCQDPSRVGLSVSDYELKVCDCVNVPRIRQDHPVGTFDTVACERNHDAEVFFSGNIWQANAAYPGENRVDADAGARCASEFARYVGQPILPSVFHDWYWYPSRTTWIQDHDRHIACVAYHPTKQVDFSVRGSRT